MLSTTRSALPASYHPEPSRQYEDSPEQDRDLPLAARHDVGLMIMKLAGGLPCEQELPAAGRILGRAVETPRG
jgi:hypothetical protein